MGYKSSGTDFASMFMSRVNTKRADVNYDDGGIDISNLYEAIGDGTPRANVGFKSGGTDLAQLFRDINDDLVSISFPTSPWSINTTDVGSQPECGFELQNDGDTLKTSAGGSWLADNANDWLSTAPSAGAGSNYEYYYTISGTPLTSAPPEGSAANFQTLGTTRRFYLSFVPATGTRTCTIIIRIRKNGDSGSQITRSITLTQEGV